MGEMVTKPSSATIVRELRDGSASGGTRTYTTLSMVYIGLGSFLLRVVLRESSIDVKERDVRALDVIQAMVNMVLRVTAVALDRQGSTDHVSPRVVIALKGEAILWM